MSKLEQLRNNEALLDAITRGWRRALAEGRLPSGEQSVVWDGTDRFGSEVAAGTYVIRMTSDRASESRLVTRVR